jgi:hypothetical protein
MRAVPIERRQLIIGLSIIHHLSVVIHGSSIGPQSVIGMIGQSVDQLVILPLLVY